MSDLERAYVRSGLDNVSLADVQLAVIGGLLMSPELVGETAARLPLDLFDDEGAHQLYDAILRLHFAGKPVDRVTLQLEAGPDYAAAIDEALKRPATDLAYYGDLLLEYNALWRLQVMALELREATSLREAAPIVDRMAQRLVSRQSVRPVRAEELISRYLQRKREHLPPPERVDFGLYALDEALNVRRGDVVVIGGYASAGKTLLAIQFALHMAQTYKVGFFSLETNEDKVGERLLSRFAQIDFRDIKRGTESKEDLQRAVDLGIQIGDYKGSFEVIHAANLSVQDIQALTLAYHYDVIFVDYLQIVAAPGRDIRERITNVSMGLHTMAQTHNVTVVELAQLTRPEKVKGKAAPPDMWSFKESGQIENDADVAMLLYPSDLDDNQSQRTLKVSKNKDGSKVRLLLDFDGSHQSLALAQNPVGEQVNNAWAAARSAKPKAPMDQVSMYPIVGNDPNLPF